MPSRKINTSVKPAASTSPAKPVATKRVLSPAKQAKAAKPANVPAVAATQAPAPEAKSDMRAIAHSAAASAVAAFYTGASKPFKAAGDRFQPLNFDNAKAATPRQAALLLAMLTYNNGNIQRNGTFTRGKFAVPAHLVFDAAQLAKLGIARDTSLAAQPESGCLGNMLGRVVEYVSGPKAGSDQREQILRINAKAARAEILATFGDKHNKLVDSILA